MYQYPNGGSGGGRLSTNPAKDSFDGQTDLQMTTDSDNYPLKSVLPYAHDSTYKMFILMDTMSSGGNKSSYRWFYLWYTQSIR